MKKFLLLMIFSLFCCLMAAAQKNKVDSLTTAYKKNRQDTTLVQLLEVKSGVYRTANRDSGMLCARQSLTLSRKIHFKKGEVRGLVIIAGFLSSAGDLPGSLKITFEALPKAKEIDDTWSLALCYNSLGLTYSILKDYQKGLDNLYEEKNICEKRHRTDLLATAYNNIGKAYIEHNKLDSAYYFIKKTYDLALKIKMLDLPGINIAYPIRSFGIIEFKKGNFKGAIDFYRKSIENIPGGNDHYLLSEDYRRIAEACQRENKTDSCVYYGKQALEQAKLDKNPDQVMRATILLTDVFKSKNDFKEAFGYQQIMLIARDSLFSQQKTLQIKNLSFEEEQRRDAIEAAKVSYQTRVRFYALLGIIGAFILIASILLYANQKRKKTNHLLHQRNEQIETQRQTLENTLEDLKNTQTQLVQREKMASLGELTAGIAHEIQNPLNFVNNFSEVNTELIEEMEQEIDKGDLAEIKAIALDIKENEKKINMHGKRADSIVKGMLQHSKATSGAKEPTDINALADEYLRLAFHGLRAKDKTFNAEMITRFDPDLPKVNVSQQDIGRVMLNLFNNAFYAVNQKLKMAGAGYKPEVMVSTAVENDRVVIKVKDNGIGIPDAIKEKIMQPFFTTKPTGEGTGLGLSLTYDMVVKGHGGSIGVQSKDNHGSVFTITLPLS